MTRSRDARRALVLLALGAAAVACGDGKSTAQRHFDALVSFTEGELLREGVPGASIAVVVDGEVRFRAGVGVKQQGAPARVTPSTRFGVGSVTKMLTAAGVLTLVDEGKLDLDAPVAPLTGLRLAGDDARAARITMRHLLTHTAGLPDEAAAVCSGSLADHFAAARPPLWSDPGALWNYSNMGYALAGLALERAAGLPYAVAMRARVFSPLAMGTTFDPAEAMAGDHSLGHVAGAGGALEPVELDSNQCAASVPEGMGTYGTADDLARFATALLDGGGPILEPASRDALWSDQVETHLFPGERYGLGIDAAEPGGLRVLYHDGDDGRFTSFVAIVPARRFAVVVLMNSGAGVPALVADEALRLFLGTDRALPVHHLIDGDWRSAPSTWARYVGTYEEPFTFGRAVVTIEGDALQIALPDLDAQVTPRPIAGDTFLVEDDGAPPILLTFWVEDGADEAAWIVTREGVFARVPSDPP